MTVLAPRTAPRPTYDVTPPLFGDRLGFEECEHALHHGATIEVADIDMSVDVDRLPEIIPGAQALFVLDASGRARWLDRGDLSLGRGEIVGYLSPPESIEQEREP